jgi:hypothetical protein
MATMIRVTRKSFAALVGGRQGRVADELSEALDAVREPRAELVLERAGAEATCWIGEDAACLLVPESEGVFRAFSLDFEELPPALLRAVGARDAESPGGPELVVGAGELATALARAGRGQAVEGRLGRVLDGFAAHWRIDAGARALEVIDAAAGCWAVEPADAGVELRPVSGAWIAEAIADLPAVPHA